MVPSKADVWKTTRKIFNLDVSSSLEIGQNSETEQVLFPFLQVACQPSKVGQNPIGCLAVVIENPLSFIVEGLDKINF
jgi:hypothetical protein